MRTLHAIHLTKFLICFFWILSIQQQTVAQTPALDSLFKLPVENRNDPWALEVLNASWEIMYSEPRTALKTLTEVQDILQKNELDSLISRLIVNRGIAYDILNEPDSALLLYREGYRVAQSDEDAEMQASALNNIGLIHWNQSRIDSALEYYQQSEVIFSSIGEKSGLMSTQNNIGLIYMGEERIDDAIQYFLKVLDGSQKGESEYFESTALQNLGISYTELDSSDVAIDYLLRAITIQHKIENQWGLAKSYHSLFKPYSQLGEFKLAIQAGQEAIAINRKLNNHHALASNFYQLGDPFWNDDNLVQATAWIDSAKKHISLVHDPDLEKSILRAKVELFLLKESPDLAVDFRRDIALSDSLNNDNVNGRLLELMEKYESEQKEEQIKLQELEIEIQKSKNRNQLIIAIISGILVIGFAVWFIARQRYRRKIESLEFQHKMQDEKHRISRDLHDNVGAQLTSIATRLDMMSYDSDESKATSDLNKVSSEARQTIDLLRDTIWAMNKEGYSSSDFLSRVKAYGRRYFGESIQVELSSKGKIIELNPTEALNLFRIVQEAFQNTLKHAEATKVMVSFNGDDWILEIKDNGIGFSTSSSGHEHYGFENMKERASEIGLHLEISSKPAEGTVILIEHLK